MSHGDYHILTEVYERNGFTPLSVLLEPLEADEVRRAVDGHLGGSTVERYELTDPIHIASRRETSGEVRYRYASSPVPVESRDTFPFLFNLWKADPFFLEIARHPRISAIAGALLHSDKLLLMEDNVVVKQPHTPTIPWHQDLPYWPIDTPDATTVWIALDTVDHENGTMQVAVGSHHTPEHLPVHFGDASPFMAAERPSTPRLPQTGVEERFPIVTYEVGPGEGAFHHPLVWHGSVPNRTDRRRCALVLRYVRPGTVWRGSARMPYDDIGCAVGEPLSARHFPEVRVR